MRFSALILTVSNVLYALMPVLNRVLTDHYLAPTEAAKPLFSDPAVGVLAIAGMMVLTRAVGEVLYVFSTRMANRVGSRFADDLRNQAYDKVQRLSLSSMSKKTSGDLMKRITSATSVIRQFMTDQGRYVIEQSIMLVGVTVILRLTNPLLTLMVFLPVPAVIWFISWFFK